MNTAYLANINQLLTPAGGSLVHVQKAGYSAVMKQTHTKEPPKNAG